MSNMSEKSEKCITLADYEIKMGVAATHLSNYLSSHEYSRVFVLVDENTYRDCYPKIAEVLSNKKAHLIQISSGEINKNINTCQYIWSQLMEQEADRKALMINLGGGVIGDMGGFCASTYKRGIDFLQIPTTLLSQVDASIGGKLGIDFQEVKNSIGLFKNPKTVLVDSTFLETLSKREVRSGLAELIKHGLIADEAAWKALLNIENIQKVDWAPLVYDSLLIKQKIVTEDPFEKGIRKSLNFGHTVGHAVESHALQGDRPFLHGEAVAIGMVVEAFLSHKVLGLEKEAVSSISSYVKKIYGFHPIKESDFNILLRWMRQDKKNDGQGINFSLLPKIGAVEVNQICDSSMIIEGLYFYNEG